MHMTHPVLFKKVLPMIEISVSLPTLLSLTTVIAAPSTGEPVLPSKVQLVTLTMTLGLLMSRAAQAGQGREKG